MRRRPPRSTRSRSSAASDVYKRQVRCLKPFTYKLELTGWALHLPLEGEDKVSILNDCIDLTPFVREDMLIEFPQHPLCKPECAGLKKKPGVEKAGAEEKPPSPWTELDKLKL